MKKWFGYFFLISILFLAPITSTAEEDHKDSKKDSKKSARSTEDSKKPVSLLDKWSACLNERPGSSSSSVSNDSSGNSSSPSTWASDSKPSGEVLFTKHCASCHSPGKSQGPISNWSLAAERAGTDMPPSGAAIPTDELTVLQDYLRSRSK